MVATDTPRRTHEPSLADDDVLALYKHMLFARALDERLVALQRDGEIGFHLSGRGEEALTLGAVAALREKDWVFHTGREAAAALWRMEPDARTRAPSAALAAYLAHVLGSAADPAKGRPMPEAFASRAARFAPAGGARGTHLTHAVGAAWAAKKSEARAGAHGAGQEVAASLAFFAAASTSSGDFHNAMNFAGVFKAPAVLVCKSAGAAGARETATSAYWVKAVAYGVPGVLVDGADLFAVHRAVRDAVARAARGEGATLIEAHLAEGADPLARVRQHLEARRAWTERDDADHAARVRAELDAAISAASAAPPPARATMFNDVFAEIPWHLREQRGA